MRSLFLLLTLCLSLLAAPAHAAEKQPPAAREGLVLVAFGTTIPESKAALDALGQAYATQNMPVLWAYTSDIIRNKLKKQGKPVLSVTQALDSAKKMGLRDLRVQSLHIAPGEEFHQLERILIKYISRHPRQFTSLRLGHPLLESEQDMNDVLDALFSALPRERAPDEAVVFMGHGNDRGPGDLTLYALGKGLQARDERVWLAAVEGSSSFDKVLEQLKAKGVKRVWLQPLMIVAGDHALNDMAGDDADSWASRIRAAGMEAIPLLKGLGENAGIQAVFLRHTRETTDDLANSKKADLQFKK